MEVLIIFMLFFSIFLHTEAIDTNCPANKCSQDGPNILFPFSIQELHAKNCSNPGFKLLCRANKTIIHFPSYGDLVVKSISYDTKKLNLLDPKNCVHEVFLNLNLSHTPFKYYYVVKNYMYLNCSARLFPPFVQVPCLSGSKHHVYIVESFQVVPVSCKPVKTVAVPLSYSPYLADNSFGLGFTWDLPGREYFEMNRGCLAHRKVLCILIIGFMAATLISVKTYCSKNPLDEKFLGYCETLKNGKYFESGFGNYANDDFKEMLPNDGKFSKSKIQS